MLRIYSLSNFHVYHTTLLSILISYIPSNYLSYNWKFLSLDHLFPILPPVTPTFDSNKSYLSLFFFMNLVLFIFVDITCLSSHPSVGLPVSWGYSIPTWCLCFHSGCKRSHSYQ